MKIAVVGTGYVGLVTGTCFAETGNTVTCIDIDQRKVESLNNGVITIYEPGLEVLFKHNREKGRLKFTTNLAEKAKALGVRFMHNVKINRLLTENNQLSGVEIDAETDRQVLKADHYVVALGSYSRELMLGLGLQIPVYPVKGYSLTVPITNSAMAPVSTVMDETYKVAITRFDDRIRVGGMAELAGFDSSLNLRRRETLEMVLNGLFPNGGDLSKSIFWTGLRPMTPDGTPIIGKAAARYNNVWLNTGHGTLGWTMACGSGQLLADLLANKCTAIQSVDFALTRYNKACKSPALQPNIHKDASHA
jgi:D-amino-acid dehydrogenase